MKKNTKLFIKVKDATTGYLHLLLLMAMLVFSTSSSAQVLFSQDFASSTTLSTYVNSGSPTIGQFNAVTVSGSSTASTATNALQFTRGSGTTSYTRSTNFSTIPSALIYEFDLNVSGTPSGNVSQVATWQVGSGYSTATNGVETNANTYAQMAIDFRGTGNYRFNDITNTTTSSNFSTGTSRTITWVMNNSGSTLSYVAPGGTTETIASDRMDFWVGTTKVYNDQLVQTTSGSISDLKFAFTTSTGSITIDNIQIQALVTPQVSAFSGNTICSGATGQLTVTTSAGTGPFTLVYNDGANQTVTGVTSGVAFNAVNNPSSTTNYTLVSITEASGAIRTSGFTDSAATITVNGPTASAGSALPALCQGSTSAALGGSVGGTATGGTWSDGGVGGTFSPNATTLNATWTPPANYSGTATLTLTTSGGSCGSTSASKSQVVNGQPTASAGGTQTICVNATATVSGATSSNGTILWTDNGLGSITSGATTLTPVYTPAAGDAGNTVTLTMTVSNSPCAAATATYTIIVKALPTATAGGSQTICVNSTATVSGATATNGTISWTENGLGSITSGANTLTPVYTPAAGDAGTAVTLTMTVTNSPCAVATATYTVTVNGIPTASAGGSQTICPFATATVSGATSSNGTIAWTENGLGSITSGANTLTPVYTPAAGDAGTTVTLTMTVSNSPCAAATATYTVIVSPAAPAAPGSITGATSVCAGATLLNYSIAAVANATNYTWTVPSGWAITSGQGSTNISVTAGSASTGTITVVASNSCGSTNPSATSVLNIAPIAGANNTGFTTSSTKSDGNITCASSLTAPERRGYLKFPLTGLPAGAVITASTLSITNNASGALSGVVNNVNALGNNDPTTTAASTLYTAIGSGVAYNATTWSNTGTIALTMNATAIADMQSRLSSPSYIAMGLFRGQGTSIYNFLGYGGGASAPKLAVTYTTPRSLTVTSNAILTPTFAAVSPICAGATLSALPTISTNGITGTWSPALNNLATTTYTFTPNLGECAVSTTMQIVVNPILIPDFTPVASICSGTTLSALPTVSNNGVSGTWSPALNNLATTTYTFTPNNGECATPTALTIVVNSNTLYYADADGDSYGNAAVSINTCLGQPVGYVTNNTDCDDTNVSLYRTGSFYTDADNDGYNNGAPPTTVCYGLNTPNGYTVTNDGTDCFDMDFNINPNHVEVLGNGKDDNCDGQIDEVGPVSIVTASQCGIALASLASTIYVAMVPSATGYRFEVTNGATVRMLDRSVNRFSLLDLNGGAAYATTYTIKVSVQVGGFWQAFGSPCSVSTPNTIATTNIIPSQCGTTLTNIANTIYCDAVAAANQYRFEVSDGVNPARTMDSPVNRFEPHHLLGGLNFGTTYSVRVALRFGSTWEDFGPACSITTPSTPGTSNVIAAQCGVNLSNLWGTIYAAQIPVAAGYRFEVTKSGGGTVFYDTPNARFSLRNITVPGFTVANATYTIRVSILFNSVYQPFGNACTITTNGASRVTNTPIAVFEVKAYPNPFANNFKLDINTSSEQNISLQVYDMIGRAIEVRQSDVAAMTTLEIGNLYPSGVYNVIVTQGENVKTLRIVKR